MVISVHCVQSRWMRRRKDGLSPGEFVASHVSPTHFPDLVGSAGRLNG
jgi:hypothetical protein